MKWIRCFIFLLVVLNIGCDENDEIVKESSQVFDIILANSSTKPCYMWLGHSTTPSGILLSVGGSYYTSASLTVKSYENYFNESPTYYTIESYLKVNVADTLYKIIADQKLNIVTGRLSWNQFQSLKTVKVTWNGKNLDWDYF